MSPIKSQSREQLIKFQKSHKQTDPIKRANTKQHSNLDNSLLNGSTDKQVNEETDGYQDMDKMDNAEKPEDDSPAGSESKSTKQFSKYSYLRKSTIRREKG